MNYIQKSLEKLAYKMENDAASAGALAGGVGAGLYAAKKHQEASKAIGKSALKGLKRGVGIGAGMGASLGALIGHKAFPSEFTFLGDESPTKLFSRSQRLALMGPIVGASAAQGGISYGASGLGIGAAKGVINARNLRSKRNAALAIAGLLGGVALATKEK